MSTVTTEIHTALLIHVTDEESKATNTLADLLENYFAPESMDGCFCDQCQTNQRKSIRYSLERLPRYLNRTCRSLPCSTVLSSYSVMIFYLKRWHITKNSHGELESVSKENHPIDCSMEINVHPFCSSSTLQPNMIDHVRELPNLKDLLRQRDEILAAELDAKRARMDETCSTDKPRSLSSKNDASPTVATHADYRLFALINHHGGSSDVGKAVQGVARVNHHRHRCIQGITLPQSTTPKGTPGGRTTTHPSARVRKNVF